MAAVAERAPIHFVLSTGDNIYPAGVRSADDPQWEQKFERMYAAPSLQVPWYPVLGNHDYRGRVRAYIAYSARNPRWHMPANFYRVLHFLPDSTPVLFLGLDTQQLLTGSAQARRQQLAWVEQELGRFPKAWKFVWGHHPLRSAGAYGENPVLLRLLKPLFDRYGVAVYFCGHEHDLQLLRHPDDGFYCVVSGAGGGVRSTAYGPHSLFAAAEPGFVYAALGKQRLQLWFIGADGMPRYRTDVPKPEIRP
jgi:acid phosphatase